MNTEHFTCGQCGACCRQPGHVYLTGEDIGRLAGYLRVGERECIDRYTTLAPNRGQLTLAMAEDEACVFLDGNRCAVYPARPRQCRDFPHRWGSRCNARRG